MAASVTKRVRDVKDIVEVLEAWERRQEYKNITADA